LKLTTCVGPWRAKKIAEYGSLENLLRNYKCRGVNKKLRQEKLKESMKNSFISADAWIQSGIEALSALERA
jgi:hypothetical protein